MSNKNNLTSVQGSLRGDGAAAQTTNTAQTGDQANTRLNELSALAAEEMAQHNASTAPPQPNQTTNNPTAYSTQPPMSQDPLIEAPVPLQFQQPSQPDIPPPVLTDSQTQQQHQHMQLPMTMGEDGKLNPMATMMFNPEMMGALMGGQLAGMAGMDMWGSHYMTGGVGDEAELQAAAAGRRSQGKKQTRRGPMDEMRQLVRILVKVIPHSVAYITSGEEQGGGNRISEEQIKNYLERTLGEAPRPAWGVPSGWNGYLSELFSWASGRTITPDQSKGVAKREPGRSWEAIESELDALGIHPAAWPLPLTSEGVKEAEKNPVPLPVPVIVPAAKKSAGAAGEDGGAAGGGTTGGGGGTTGASAPSRRSKTVQEKDLDKLSEEQIWRLILDAITAATNKRNTGDVNNVMQLQLQVKDKFDALLNVAAAGAAGGMNPLSMYQYPLQMAMMSGLDQNSLMSLMAAGGQFPGLEGMDMQQATAAMAQAQAMANMAQHQQQQGMPMSINAVPAEAMEGMPQQQQQQMQQDGGAAAAAAAGVPVDVHAGDVKPPVAKRARKDGGGDGSSPGAGADVGNKAPMSSNEARSTLLGALGNPQYNVSAIPGTYAALSIPNIPGMPTLPGGQQTAEQK